MRSLLFLLLCSSILFADTLHWVHLKDGGMLEGRILKETEQSIVFSTHQGKATLILEKQRIEKIEEALETENDFVEKVFSLLQKKEHHAQALQTLDIGLQLYPKSEKILALKARTLLTLQKYKELEIFLKKELALNPKAARLHFEAAIFQKVQGNFSRALQHLKLVRGLVPFTELDQLAKEEMKVLTPLLQNPPDVSIEEERDFFDKDLGNCHDAFMVAQKIQEMFENLEPNLELKIFLRLQANEKDFEQYEKGGNLLLFRSQVHHAQLNILTKGIDYRLKKSENYSLLMKSALRFLHSLYPNAFSFSLLTDGNRNLIEGVWAHYREEPILKIKIRGKE